MDWAKITDTINRLDTLSAEELADELEELRTQDPALAAEVSRLKAGPSQAGSFMQTRMPGDEATSTGSLHTGERVGVWQIEELLGAGGMGEVYKAQRADGLFEQQVALKLAKDSGDAFRTRFDAERQRLAQLEHPNIARIVDGGTSESGAPFMTMEFVDGEPINVYTKGGRLDRNGRITLISSLCAAVAHAHGRLVLHRDIKHDNVLINADGEVRLIDFGVASLLDDPDADQTRGPLTLAYAAPEQLRGEAVSAATDIFAIGMLGHLLETGSLPKRQSGGGVTIDAGRIGDADLAAILAKATATDPTERYGSADALRDDLENWLSRLPVSARGGGALYRVGKFAQKHWLATAASVFAVAALVGGLAVSLWQTQQAINARNLALAEEERSDTIRESLYFLLAEAGEGEEGSATSSSISRAALTIGERFDRAPREYAAVLQALGELQFYLSDDVGALASFDRLLAREELIEPDILAQARLNAAQAHMRQGNPESAKPLLQKAQSFWRKDLGKWAVRLRDSRLVEAQIMRSEDAEGAVELLRETLKQHVEQYGNNNQRAGVFANNIGTALIPLGKLEDAEAAFLEADRTWKAIGLASGFDALNTLNNAASVQYLQNKHQEAAASFARAVKLRDQLFGPSAATAALLSNYGKALLAVGKPDLSLVQFERAEPMSAQFAGSGSPLHISAQLGKAEALAGQKKSGSAELLTSVRGQIAQMGDPLPLMAVFYLASGKVSMASGSKADAQRDLNEAIKIASEIGTPADRIRAEGEALLDKLT